MKHNHDTMQALLSCDKCMNKMISLRQVEQLERARAKKNFLRALKNSLALSK